MPRKGQHGFRVYWQTGRVYLRLDRALEAQDEFELQHGLDDGTLPTPEPVIWNGQAWQPQADE